MILVKLMLTFFILGGSLIGLAVGLDIHGYRKAANITGYISMASFAATVLFLVAMVWTR